MKAEGTFEVERLTRSGMGSSTECVISARSATSKRSNPAIASAASNPPSSRKSLPTTQPGNRAI